MQQKWYHLQQIKALTLAQTHTWTLARTQAQSLVQTLAQTQVRMENSITESDKYPLITKVPRAPLHPVPKSHGHPKSMNKLTLNEPATVEPVTVRKLSVFQTPPLTETN